jgi:two-component system alkaline phosphatase synthesis response regulator PhoP
MQTHTSGQGATILIVEDDADVASTLVDALESSGHKLLRAGTAAEARALVASEHPDLVILDLTLPDADGLVLCADLTARFDVPIIICSASHEKRDRVLGLKLGADDFISKPFDVDELEARVDSVLRRVARQGSVPAASADLPGPGAVPHGQIRIEDLEVDHVRRRVMLRGRPVQLTPTEYRLLRTLAAHHGDVLSREDLAQQVWGYHEASNGRAVDVHVGRLRAKLVDAAGGGSTPAIVSARGFGYKLVYDARGAGEAHASHASRAAGDTGRAAA